MAADARPPTADPARLRITTADSLPEARGRRWLGLAAIAGSWALFGEPGDWSFTATVIGLTIAFILLGFHGGART